MLGQVPCSAVRLFFMPHPRPPKLGVVVVVWGVFFENKNLGAD